MRKLVEPGDIAVVEYGLGRMGRQPPGYNFSDAVPTVPAPYDFIGNPVLITGRYQNVFAT